ncbi:MAG: WYL domain-containing transcriptional regulator [Anaerolineae bacterium]|nr:WYL domain-containing transcriptional regulator [Anaerolineae bacterium]
MTRSMNRVARLQRMEEMLLSARYLPGEMANRLGVHRTQVHNDLNELQDNGIPIQQEEKDEGGRYYIDKMNYLSNVRLNQAESLVLYLAIRRLIRRTTHVPPAMVSAIEKLILTLRHPLADQLAASIRVAQADRPVDPERAKVWETLARAWIEQITVRIEYQKFDSEQVSVYEIQPYLFEPAILSEGVYVIGHSLTHKARRTFKVERVTRATLTTLSFTRPDDLDIDTLLRHAWGIWYGVEPTEVRLRFYGSAAGRVKETLWHPLQEIEELADGSIEWRVRVAGTIELVPWIRGWGPDCEVLAPPELRERIADEMRRAAQLYEQKGE